jgi:hypothetical protein
VLIIIGRHDPFIQADGDGQRIFLYDLGPSGGNTLVPLSEDEYLRYHAIRGRKLLKEKHSYYQRGRENGDKGIIEEDIKRKVIVLEALFDTAKNMRTNAQQKLDDLARNAQKILEALKQEYPQLAQQLKFQHLETQLTNEISY